MSYKLLAVEGNAESRVLLDRLFTSKGYNVTTACNGCEGLNMAIVEKPDLIITEFSIPRMCAIEMIGQIRTDPEIAHTPILVFTSEDKETAELAKAVGANLVFFKSTDLDELMQSVSLLVRESDDN
jgi:CheY-like chemotaxis protein